MFYRGGGSILECYSYSGWYLNIVYLILENPVIWLKVCSKTGDPFIHSMSVGNLEDATNIRFLERLSHRIHMKSKIDIREVRDPKDEMMFQNENPSG